MNLNRLVQGYKKQNRYIRELTDVLEDGFVSLDDSIYDIKDKVDKIKEDTTEIKDKVKAEKI